MTQPTGLIFRALPEIQPVKIRLTANGQVSQVMPNQLCPVDEIEARLNALVPTVFHPKLTEERLADLPWLINFCADADDFEDALTQLSALQSRTKTPIFNHPDAVLRSRRDTAAGLVEGIPNLIVPKCIRFTPAHFDDIRKSFERNAFEFPVLVRPAASQTGQGLVKIDSHADWDRLHDVNWQGLPLYMTQFVDYRNEKGDFAKIRIFLSGGRSTFRAVFFSDKWKVHAVKRTPEVIVRELPYVQRKDWPELSAISDQIGRRIGLDSIGIDLGLIDDSSFVFFEANAAMTVFRDYMLPEFRREAYVAIKEKIGTDFLVALSEFGGEVDVDGFNT